MNIKIYFALLSILFLSGCGLLYEVKNGDTPSFVTGGLKQGEKSGSARIYISPESTYEIYVGSTDLYLIAQDSRYNAVKIKGITIEYEDSCLANTISMEGCLHRLVKSHGLQRVDFNKNQVASVNKSGLMYKFTVSDRNAGDVYIQYVDSSTAFQEWIKRYPVIATKNSVDSYLAYAAEYPGTEHSLKVLQDMLKKFFSIKLISSSESKPRQISDDGFLVSTTGACKDILREVKIAPMGKEVPSSDINLVVKYTLKRTYKPLWLNREGDPLYKTSNYYLGRKNNFTVSEKVRFDCVTTSLKAHTGLISDQNTTLTNISFEIDIQEVR